jgi:hypothetical protein
MTAFQSTDMIMWTVESQLTQDGHVKKYIQWSKYQLLASHSHLPVQPQFLSLPKYETSDWLIVEEEEEVAYTSM